MINVGVSLPIARQHAVAPVTGITGQSLPVFTAVRISLAAEMIFVSRLESRSRQVRMAPLGSVRRNISSTCWGAEQGIDDAVGQLGQTGSYL